MIHGYKMELSNWDHTITFVNGVAQEPCINNLEMCKKCARNLFIHIDVLQRRYLGEEYEERNLRGEMS